MNWGFIGTGTMAGRMIKVFPKIEGQTVKAAWSLPYEQAQAFCIENGIEKACRSLEEMLADTSIEAVYVVTPHLVHFEHVKAALDAGKHVLCEKPMTMNAEQTRELAELAREKGLFLMEAFWTRFFPGTAQLRELLQSKKYGEVRNITAEFGISIPYDPDSRFYNKELGGGSMIGAGIYPVGFTCAVLGAFPVEIKAVANMANGADIRTTAIMRFADNITATVMTGYDGTNTQSAMITCADACIVVPHLITPRVLEIQTVKELGGLPEIETIPVTFDPPGYQYELEEAVRCIAEGKTESSIMPLADSVKLAEVFDEIYAQIRSN